MSGVLKGGHEAKFIFTSGTLSPMEHQFINQNTNQHLVQPGHVWEHGRGKPQNAAFWKRAFGAKVKHRVPIASKEQIMNTWDHGLVLVAFVDGEVPYMSGAHA